MCDQVHFEEDLKKYSRRDMGVLAAATAVATARSGLRTLVLSNDPAHSLGDAFAAR